ncbi:EAL domain-containing protein [Acidithiobacillus thiooxidans]|uniref:bifunctional diguanylate cyclase/phosphodiesterase n=1 Tax=Acidithiobacillus thiooxidans TaxID=930 RepID=UPI0002624D9E|nr:EAL domain-containing protein [Acidithiobacillus thiooxidans]MBU2810280.1 EAL domain-containing protein [Acidithiobacillus thiooxidans]
MTENNLRPHNDRWILRVINTFFVLLIFLFSSVVLTRALLLQTSIKDKARDQAKTAATYSAAIVAAQLNAHSTEMEILTHILLTQETTGLAPNRQIRTVFLRFARTQPSLVAMSIVGHSGHILWQYEKPGLPTDHVSTLSLPASPKLVAMTFDPNAQAYVFTLVRAVPGTNEHKSGSVRYTFMIPALHWDDSATHLDLMSRLQEQRLSPFHPGALAGEVSQAVPGYSLDIRASWTKKYLQQAFWKRIRPRIWIVAGILLFILLAWGITRRLFARILRQRKYQDAALRIQQGLMHRETPEAMYQLVVNTIVEETGAIGAYMVVPEEGTDQLMIVAFRAETPDLQQALRELTPSKDPENFPHGKMLLSEAFRTRSVQGPRISHGFATMAALQKRSAALRQVQSFMAFPVCPTANQDPAAVLVVHSNSARHFTVELQHLLNQLTITLGIALMRWSDRQALLQKNAELAQMGDEVTRQNGLMAALIEAIPDAVFLKDGVGRWRIVNESAIRLFRLQDIPWRDKTDLQLADLHPEFREIHLACLDDDEKAWRDQNMVVVEESMYREDGVFATFETRKVPVFTKEGDRLGLVILGRDITERKAHEAQIQHLAFYDSLTNLPNRRFLEVHLEQGMLRAQRHQRSMAVCILDLDQFKPVNDTYGHEAGDEVLLTLSRRLTKTLRQSDFVARLGGDEFVLLLEDLSQPADIYPTLQKVQAAIVEPIPLSMAESVHVGVSMGVTFYPTGQRIKTAKQILREADQALYANKAHKQERVHPWTVYGVKDLPEIRTPAQALLDAGHLEVWYQPILDNLTRRVVGLEALARLREAEGKLWTPARFLPELQDADFTVLTKGVLSQALVDLAVLDAQGYSLWVSVNLDAHSVSAECVECLRALIASTDIDPSRVTLEILEGDDFLDRASSIEHLIAMKKLGVHLALDDLGSAYGSLMRLKTLPFDKIKLDQSFVRTLEKQPRDLYFVNTVQDLSTNLGVTLVVEGVETKDILDAVTVTGASLLQGYAIARPLPLKELQQFLQRPTIERSIYPQTFLGLYALHLSLHSVLEKTMRQNLRLMDYKEMVDSDVCPLHRAMQHLGVSEGSPLDRRHREYHKAIAELIHQLSASPENLDWCIMEEAQNALKEAILNAYKSTDLR